MIIVFLLKNQKKLRRVFGIEQKTYLSLSWVIKQLFLL